MAVVSKYKSPTSNDDVGAEDAILYLSANELTPLTLFATVVTLLATPATVPIFAITPDAFSAAIFELAPATVFILLLLLATVLMLV